MSTTIGSTEFARAHALQVQAAAVRRDIALAKEKLNGIQGAIKSREQHLARLEAQLVLTSAARQTSSRSAR